MTASGKNLHVETCTLSIQVEFITRRMKTSAMEELEFNIIVSIFFFIYWLICVFSFKFICIVDLVYKF